MLRSVLLLLLLPASFAASATETAACDPTSGDTCINDRARPDYQSVLQNRVAMETIADTEGTVTDTQTDTEETDGDEDEAVAGYGGGCSVKDESNCCFTKAAVKFAEQHKDKIPKGVTVTDGMCAYGASSAAPEFWPTLVKLLEKCKTDACKKMASPVPKIPKSQKCKDYKCPADFKGKKAGSDNNDCSTVELCDFNCCALDINASPKRRNGYLTFGIITSIQNITRAQNQLSQQDNPMKPKSWKPESIKDLLDQSAGLYHVMHKVMDHQKAKDHCGDGTFSDFRACVHNGLCIIEKYAKANGHDNRELKTYTMLVEMYEDFKTLTWPQLALDLALEGVPAIGNFDFMPKDELMSGCDGFGEVLGTLKTKPTNTDWKAAMPASKKKLLELGSEDNSAMAAAVRVSESLIEAAKTTHAVLDALADNSSEDGTVAALHQAWTEPCKLLGCDHTNYWDLLGASFTHSVALLDLGVSAHHMKVHVVTRSRLEKRMQQFLSTHALDSEEDFAEKILREEGTLTVARMSQYSETLLAATKTTLTEHATTYGVDSLLLSMADRSHMREFAKTQFQKDVLDTLYTDSIVAYSDPNKVAEKLKLPPSAIQLEEPEEDMDDDMDKAISHRASLLDDVDKVLSRKGFAKFWEGIGKGIAHGVSNIAKGAAKIGKTIRNGIVKGFTAFGEAIVEVAKGIYAGIKMFVDFIIMLFSCLGFGTVKTVGYNKSFGKYLAMSFAIVVKVELQHILEGKPPGVSIAVDLGMVAGKCPGKKGVGMRIGLGIAIGIVCKVGGSDPNGCVIKITVGAVASALRPKRKHNRCINGYKLLGFYCSKSTGITIKLICCVINLITGCESCKGSDACKNTPVESSRKAQEARQEAAAHIANDGANLNSCNEEMTGNGNDYRGCQTITKGGRLCQKWSVQYPHKHVYSTSSNDDNEGVKLTWHHNANNQGVDNHDFCRNPAHANAPTIWCYTVDPEKRWETCTNRVQVYDWEGPRVFNHDHWQYIEQGNCLGQDGRNADIPLNGPYMIEAQIKPSGRNNGGGIVGWGTFGHRRRGKYESNYLRVDGRRRRRWTSNSFKNVWWNRDLGFTSANELHSVKDGEGGSFNPTGAWHHVAVNYDGNERKGYVDFELASTDRPGRREDTDWWMARYREGKQNFCIGATNWHPGGRRRENFDGWIRKVKIWNYARDPTEAMDSDGDSIRTESTAPRRRGTPRRRAKRRRRSLRRRRRTVRRRR